MPTTTTALVSEEDANRAGVALLEKGDWSEFYVKTVISLHGADRAARMALSEHGLPASSEPPPDSPPSGGSVMRSA